MSEPVYLPATLNDLIEVMSAMFNQTIGGNGTPSQRDIGRIVEAGWQRAITIERERKGVNPCPNPTTPQVSDAPSGAVVTASSTTMRKDAPSATENSTPISEAASGRMEQTSHGNTSTDLPALLAKLREARSEEIDAAERGWEDSRLTQRTITMRHAVDALLASQPEALIARLELERDPCPGDVPVEIDGGCQRCLETERHKWWCSGITAATARALAAESALAEANGERASWEQMANYHQHERDEARSQLADCAASSKAEIDLLKTEIASRKQHTESIRRALTDAERSERELQAELNIEAERADTYRSKWQELAQKEAARRAAEKGKNDAKG